MKALPKGVVGLFGKLSPALKAVVAGCLPLASAIGNWVISGHFNAASIETAGLAAASALFVYLVPNKAQAPVVKS